MDARSVPSAPHFAELVRVFGRIGLLSFGGPAGQIALMHRVLVEEKRWIEEARFLHALNYCVLLPGPEAMQLATYAGWLLHSVRGGLVAGLLFVAPGALIITALAIVYLLYGDSPVAAGLLFGIKAAVLAVVVEALIKVSKRALKSSAAVAIALAAFVAIAFAGIAFPIVVIAAAAIGAAWPGLAAPPVNAPRAPVSAPAGGQDAVPGLGQFAGSLALWLGIWFLPLVAMIWGLGLQHVLVEEAIFFSKMATVTFGGAYAVLAYVAQQAVDVHGWLGADDMLAALGLAETTPGPLILVLVFVGFLGAARHAGLDPVVGGLAGAGVALWFTFVPCFLWIMVGAPYVDRLRGLRRLDGALAAVTAALVGIIASLGFWFALHVLFGQLESVWIGALSFPVVSPTSLDVVALVIALLAGVALLRLHLNLVAVLAAAALAGLVRQLL